MRRNWDLIRAVLLKIEELPTVHDTLESDGLPTFDNDTVAYHMELLLNAGLIEGVCYKAVGPPRCSATQLTWDGHEFLDAVRRDTIWNKIKETAKEKGLDLTIDVVKVTAKSVIAGFL